MGSVLASGTLPSASSVGVGGRMPHLREMSGKGNLLGKGIPAGKGSMPAGMEAMSGIGTMPSALSVPAMVTPASLVESRDSFGLFGYRSRRTACEIEDIYSRLGTQNVEMFAFKAKEVISSLNCGDPAVMGRWMHHLEGFGPKVGTKSRIVGHQFP